MLTKPSDYPPSDAADVVGPGMHDFDPPSSVLLIKYGTLIHYHRDFIYEYSVLAAFNRSNKYGLCGYPQTLLRCPLPVVNPHFWDLEREMLSRGHDTVT